MKWWQWMLIILGALGLGAANGVIFGKRGKGAAVGAAMLDGDEESEGRAA